MGAGYGSRACNYIFHGIRGVCRRRVWWGVVCVQWILCWGIMRGVLLFYERVVMMGCGMGVDVVWAWMCVGGWERMGVVFESRKKLY